jgi:hypothetical protein
MRSESAERTIRARTKEEGTMPLTQLKALPGYRDSTPLDIDDRGHVVGSSSYPLQRGIPERRATLWVVDNIPGFPPAAVDAVAISDSAEPTEAFRINNNGKVLYRTLTQQPTYWVWDENSMLSSDLSAHIPGLTQAVDLNEDDLVLAWAQAGGASAPLPVIGSLGGDPPIALPAPPSTARGPYQNVLVGLTNAFGAAGLATLPHVVLWRRPMYGPLEGNIHHLPPQSASWLDTSFSAGRLPLLDKSGLMVFSRHGQVVPDGLHGSFRCDLAQPLPHAATEIPVVGNVPWYGACEKGWIVGGWGFYPVLHDLYGDWQGDLHDHVPAPQSQNPPCGVNNRGQVLGWGRWGYAEQLEELGWVLDLAEQAELRPPPRRDPLEVMLPSSVYQKLPHVVGPPIDPGGPFKGMTALADVLRHASAEERQQVSARIDVFEAVASVVKKTLKKTRRGPGRRGKKRRPARGKSRRK